MRWLIVCMYVLCLCEIMQCSHDVMLRQGVILIVVRSQNVSCRRVAALDVFFSRSSFLVLRFLGCRVSCIVLLRAAAGLVLQLTTLAK